MIQVFSTGGVYPEGGRQSVDDPGFVKWVHQPQTGSQTPYLANVSRKKLHGYEQTLGWGRGECPPCLP